MSARSLSCSLSRLTPLGQRFRELSNKLQTSFSSEIFLSPGLKGLRGGTLNSLPQVAGRHKGVRIVAARRSLFAEMQTLTNEKSAEPVQFESPLQIVLYPDPRLRAKNKAVTVFDDRLRQLVTEMFDIMYRTDGVGLAAPQVGVNVQLMVYNPEGERGQGKEYVLVNPKITKYAREKEPTTEGCLSFPGMDGTGTINVDVERPIAVKIAAQDVSGKRITLELKGWQARIFQHEYDHLEGILYHDRMSAEVLQSIQEELEALETKFTERTGQPPPEKMADRLAKLKAKAA
eukprot:TRINITY_DN9435_c0_g1_i1.p1 TRINITY_DN9435_c0_g1~~TRINITY_DN9435_c0_g1_i1.p1  ORF type:complete len:289 (+),score=43.53 TRINITY_DN9435_c0_g1_i1:299-1165(+)